MSDPSPQSVPGSQLVKELIDLLDVERLEMNLFRGQVAEADEDHVRIYGGHVIAQALRAAYKTVEGMACYSLHAYFIHPGDPAIPVIYEVDRARDGRSFATRRVIAIQHGRQIFNLAASFQGRRRAGRTSMTRRRRRGRTAACARATRSARRSGARPASSTPSARPTSTPSRCARWSRRTCWSRRSSRISTACG